MGKECLGAWRRKTRDGGVNSEYSVSTHDLHVSIFKIKRIMTGSCLLRTVLNLSTKFSWGQVRHSGDAECGGGPYGCWGINKGLGGTPRILQGEGGYDASQDRGRDVDVDRCGREILWKEGDGSFDLFKYINDRYCPVLFSLFPLQPRNVELAKFLVKS